MAKSVDKPCMYLLRVTVSGLTGETLVELQKDLIQIAGGFTRHDCIGGWMNGNTETIEQSMLFDVVGDVWDMARVTELFKRAAVDSGQQCIMIECRVWHGAFVGV